jgi:hypothetical protein
MKKTPNLPWSDSELNLLRKYYKTQSPVDLAHTIGSRTPAAIRAKLKKLNLQDPEPTGLLAYIRKRLAIRKWRKNILPGTIVLFQGERATVHSVPNYWDKRYGVFGAVCGYKVVKANKLLPINNNVIKTKQNG